MVAEVARSLVYTYTMLAHNTHRGVRSPAGVSWPMGTGQCSLSARQHTTPFVLRLSAFQLVSNYFKEETVISSFIMPRAALVLPIVPGAAFALPQSRRG